MNTDFMSKCRNVLSIAWVLLLGMLGLCAIPMAISLITMIVMYNLELFLCITAVGILGALAIHVEGRLN